MKITRFCGRKTTHGISKVSHIAFEYEKGYRFLCATLPQHDPLITLLPEYFRNECPVCNKNFTEIITARLQGKEFNPGHAPEEWVKYLSSDWKA